MTELLEAVPVVVRSRLRPPGPHPDELSRTRLLSRLDGSTAPVILLAAPQGAGKSVLLAQWVRRRTERCAWVSLGPQEGTLCGVWSALLQAVEPMCGGVPDLTLHNRADPDNLLSYVIPRLLNRLADTDPLILVLDGLDMVIDVRAKNSLSEFVLQLPPQLRVLLSTARPALGPVPSLRASGRLDEVTGEDLRFTLHEANALVHTVTTRAGLEHEVARLHRSVDGWAAGIRLGALALRARAQGTDGLARDVTTYLRTSVLDKAAPEERTAIARTSVLSELRTDWVTAVAGRWATRALASFARSSLFLRPTDAGWVCHPALRLAAGEYLNQTEPAMRRNLETRVWQQLAQEGDLVGAAARATKAGMPRDAADLLAAAWPSAHPQDVVEHVAQLDPEEAAAAAPTAAAAALARGHADRARQFLNHGERDDDADAVRGLLCLQTGELSGAREAVDLACLAGTPETWCEVLGFVVAGFADLWGDNINLAAERLMSAADAAERLRYCDAHVRALDGLVACSLRTGDDERALDAAVRAVRIHRNDPLRATAPVISLAYLEVSGEEPPGDAWGFRRRSDDPAGGPHQVAFAEFLRASAAQAVGDRVAYRLAQSRGRAVLTPDRAGELLSTLLADEAMPPAGSGVASGERLTSREVVVLKALCGPLTLREIARELHVSHNTVKTQVSSLFRKLGAHNRAGAVRISRELGLIFRG